MEIDRNSFNWELPSILHAISMAHCVSIDLEFSGIANRKTSRNRQDGQSGSKQTLQQRYADIKEAAEMYKILQVGLTCVEEDLEKKRYVFRSYNFFSNPLLKEKLDIDRDFSFSSEAMEFLLSWGFSMDRLLKDGVPYLSRDEEAQLRCVEATRRDKTQETLTVDSDDMVAQQFLEETRSNISKWKRLNHTDRDFLNIPKNNSNKGSRGLNAYQKRLVHQLVRAEYPDLVSFSPKPEFIQIKIYDKAREDAASKSKQESFERKIHLQTGLRWIFEAMAGGDLSRIDVASFAKVDSANPQWIDLSMEMEKFRVLRDKLKDKRTVLIGHNMFMDLVYIYHTYFGPLPDAVEDFVRLIHKTFPLIVDTKFLATRNNDASNAKSSLEELDKQFTQQPIPQIEMMTGHEKYFYANANHEAAYDSLMTAKVFIRITAFLEADGDYADVPDDMRFMWADNPDALAKTLLAGRSEEASKRQEDETPPFQPLLQQSITGQVNRWKKGRKSKTDKSSRFSSSSRFDALHEAPSPEKDDRCNAASLSLTNGKVSQSLQEKTAVPSPLWLRGRELPQLIPGWNKDFWRVFGNKIRVNGTTEGICDLSLASIHASVQLPEGVKGVMLEDEIRE